jgi:hypothetical protein
MLAFVERDGADRLYEASVYRYEMPPDGFQALDDAGMWVSEGAADSLTVERIDDLPAALEAQDVELRTIDSLTDLRGAWSSTLHVSGIRLRNARTWS